ncbi:hypothetical protein EJ02DRAFT_515682 [Clathrospora elynae]|uniref:Uncharacterized protein n=1 Tax=Clathrospora elynae TaxID=706981 RepID=A0A6A5S7V3_9PLEO|nr:hypothetical protein EJ02DRAFT_515682 [Clathrospora elynae]
MQATAASYCVQPNCRMSIKIAWHKIGDVVKEDQFFWSFISMSTLLTSTSVSTTFFSSFLPLICMSSHDFEPYHSRRCGFCGCLVNETKTGSYLAVSTKLGPATEHANMSFDQQSKHIRVDGSITSTSWTRFEYEFPSYYLIHAHCLQIFRDACPNSKVPLRYVIASASLVRQVDSRDCHRLSELDAAVIVANFNPAKFEVLNNLLYTLDTFSSFIQSVYKLPYELYESILTRCQLDLSLAITACVKPELFMQLSGQDVVRTRMTMCIQAASLLNPDTLQEVFTEKVVTLTENMKATFVMISGVEYLQNIGQESSNPKAIDFIIPRGQPKQLALRTNDVGLLNIAFGVDAKGNYNWIRPDTRKHDIVLDTRDFTAIRIVFDPVKCHMISTDLPGYKNSYPRPILPCALGNWAPLPTVSVDNSSLGLAGYIKASYIEFATLEKLYLLFDPSQVLIGIFTDMGKGRVEVRIERKAEIAVKLIRNWDRRPSLQIEDCEGRLFPVIKTPSIFQEISTQHCRGVWFAIFGDTFIFNVI